MGNDLERAENQAEFLSHRTREQKYKSLIAKKNYEEICGNLIPRSLVGSYLSIIATKIRTSLSQIPDRLAARLSQEDDEEIVHSLLLMEMQLVADSFEEIGDDDIISNDLKKESIQNPVIRSGKMNQKHRIDE